MNAPHLTRRDFTAGLGGIVLAFSLSPLALTQQPPRLPGSLQTNRLLSAWLAINADGTATVFTGKVELGQGILTALGADRGGGARSAAGAGQDHFRRYRSHAERRPDRRQPVGRK